MAGDQSGQLFQTRISGYDKTQVDERVAALEGALRDARARAAAGRVGRAVEATVARDPDKPHPREGPSGRPAPARREAPSLAE